MKHKTFIFLLLQVFCNIIIFAQHGSAFRMPASMYPSVSAIPLNQHFTADTTLFVLDSSCIYGLSVDMQIARQDSDFLVKIILEDSSGEKHLLAEAYPELSNGDTLTYSGFCEETAFLPAIHPTDLKVFVRGADVLISSLNVSLHAPLFGNGDLQNYVDSIHRIQATEKAQLINGYNEQNGKLWRAGVTDICLLPYSLKMRIIGFSDTISTQGLEYYVGGIFELGRSETGNNHQSPYVDHFDWRNRHGKNWITSIKNQGNSNYCAAFATASTLEAMVNLYYNQKLDMNLSEQEIACCNGHPNTYEDGMYITEALNYVRDYGVCDEVAYPFVDNKNDNYCRSGEITPNELVSISGYHQYYMQVDSIKKSLIHTGPMVCGYFTNQYGHAMCLVGYGIIHAGDTIRVSTPEYLEWSTVVPEGDNRIGQTYWIMKNSYGLTPWESENNGCYYILFKDIRYMAEAFALEGPISTMNYTNEDIVCEDIDGDGYYFWGLGPKPSNYPANAPDEPDGDDSNPLIGPMDRFGNLSQLYPGSIDTLYICNQVTDTISKNYNRHIVILNNAQWNIQANVSLSDSVNIFVRNGGSLVISNGAILSNAAIIFEEGSYIQVKEGSHIYCRSNTPFFLPTGAIADIDFGIIN